MVYSGIMTGIIICVLAYSCWMDIRQREIPIELYLLVILPMGIIALIMGIGPGVFEAISMAVIVGICYTILALYFQGGGGDLIMMVSCIVPGISDYFCHDRFYHSVIFISLYGVV